MYQTGKIGEPYSSQYPSHRYLMPIKRKLSAHDIDPNRLNFMHEFPRFTGMVIPTTETVELLDYEMRVTRLEAAPQSVEVDLYLLPNSYTQANTEKKVSSFVIAAEVATRRNGIDSLFNTACRLAFDLPLLKRR